MTDGDIQTNLRIETNVAFVIGAIPLENVRLAGDGESEPIENRDRDLLAPPADRVNALVSLTRDLVREAPEPEAERRVANQDLRLGSKLQGMGHGALYLCGSLISGALRAYNWTRIVVPAVCALSRPPARVLQPLRRGGLTPRQTGRFGAGGMVPRFGFNHIEGS